MAIRIFKDHLKESSIFPKYIESSNPEWDEVEDAFKFYNNLFKSKNHYFSPNGIREKYIGIMDEEFFKYVTPEKVIEKINHLPSNKACGIDGIHTVILKCINDTFFPIALSKLFNVCIKFGVTPLRWNKSIIFPIPKKEKSCHIQDFRPIALTILFRKIFESMLMDYIKLKLNFYFKLCGNQAGFRRGYSTLTHAIVSNETASRCPHQYQAFLDIKKAYDSVPIKLLIEKLEDRHLPGGILSLITSLFTECTTQIIVNKRYTDEIKLERGLMQGAILSPLLFNVFIDDLAEKITKKFPNDPLPHCLFFADDIKLNHWEELKLQEILNICSEWAHQNGMEFNEKKSAVLQDPTLPSIPFYLIKNKIKVILPEVPSYPYLGFPHTCKGIDWKEHLNRSAKRAYGTLNSLMCYQNIWPEAIKLIIFRTFIRPMMEYSAPLAFYWMKNINQLKNKTGKPDYREVPFYHLVMEKGIQWILNHNRISNASSLLLIPSTIMRLYTLALKFRVHLSKMDKDNPLYLSFHPKGQMTALSPFTFSHKVMYWNSLFKDYKYFELPMTASTLNHYTETENNKRVKRTDSNRYLLYNLSSRINKMIKNHFKTSLIMDKCILPLARMSKNTNEEELNARLKSPDKCIFIKNSVLRKRAIAWRLNAFGTNRICPLCKDTFQRSHINNCKYMWQYPFNTIIKIKDIERYKEDMKKYPELPKSYNILDSLLNHQNYKRFGKFMDILYGFWYSCSKS